MVYITDKKTNDALVKENKKLIAKQLKEKERLEKNALFLKGGEIVPAITIIETNKYAPGTCGSCEYTDNDLGIVALHCTCKKPSAKIVWHDSSGKVRSWESCKFWKARTRLLEEQALQERIKELELENRMLKADNAVLKLRAKGKRK